MDLIVFENSTITHYISDSNTGYISLLGDDMRRKLINYDVFQKISEESLSKSEKELIEAEDVLAKALGEEQLSLHCFDEGTVTYETLDKSYIHASYRLDGSNVLFENIEQLIIDDSSSREKSRQVLRKMFDECLKNNKAGADVLFKEYIALPFVRRDLSEGKEVTMNLELPNKEHKKGKSQPPWLAMKRAESKKRSQKLVSPALKAQKKREAADLKKRRPGTHVHFRFKPQVKTARKMKEWSTLSENIFNYIDYQEFGPIARESEVKKDDNGNVVGIRIPDTNSRNEGKILSFNWKTLNTDCMVLRAKMKNLAEDINFCKAMADLRKCNALSDNKKLQEVLEAIVVRWPNVIYLTQNELAGSIAAALGTIGETSYDDQTCAFMAEGILRTAVEAYDERVQRIIKLSGMKVEGTEDTYLDFQNIVERFYSFLDQNTQLEMQVFIDLYNALVEVYKAGHEEGNEYLMGEASSFLKELKAVCEQTAEPTLDLAADVAAWLNQLVETNLESEDWKVSNLPYQTVSGDHPQMAKNAAKPYQPSSDFSGDWGDSAPVSDGKSYKGGLADEMRKDAWGNWANDDTWPSISNPYVPKAGVWTMKGEKGADVSGDSDWSRYTSKDTWPELQNPYVPNEAGGVGGSGYKMKSDNLVVDQGKNNLV